jgi:rhomboid protease GluP
MFKYAKPASSLSSPTIVLIIANTLIFVVLTLGGQDMYTLLAQTATLVFQEHWYWQIFTSLFVHFDILHLLFNMYGLYYFGRLNEGDFSLPQYLAIYFGAGLLGNAASLYLIPPDVQSGGASGAIFGLLGSYIAIEKRSHRGMAPVIMALVYAALIFVSSSGPGVNIFAHLFGLAGGLALGLALSPRRQQSGYSYNYTITS